MRNLIFLMEYEIGTGGMIQSVISLIKGLSELDYNITLVCQPNAFIRKISYNNNVQVIATKRKKWYMRKNTPVKAFLTAFEIYLLIKNKLSNSLVISNDLGASFLISLFPGKHKEVYVCRGGRFTGAAGKLIKYKIKNSIFYTIATSTFQRDFIRQHCGDIANLTVIHNGLKLPEKEYEIPVLSKSLLRISVVGYIAPDKNQAEGVRLIKILRDRGVNAVLNIFGTIECKVDEEYNKELQMLIDSLSVRNFINYYGFSSQPEIYANTDILISFSKAEGFGRTLVEAMLRNRPIIAYRGAGGPIDITGDGKYGHLVDNNVATEYADIILHMLEAPEEEYSNIIKANKYALDHFTEKIMVENYDKFFRGLSEDA